VTSSGTARVVRWDRERLAARRDDVLDVYAEAMGVDTVVARARRGVLTGHLDRDGLAAAAAVDEHDALVGVAYGYVGRRGQWWHDHVHAGLTSALGRRAADSWLVGAFEVCELHVRPPAQGRGLGRQLLDELLAGSPSTTAVLTTPDAETRARAFYRAGGWQDLVRRLVFPGDPREFAVLGLRRALRDP
jgi:ribosomal protein S18 acetylase RimI-like enzyme